jgi:hypothetical protein
MRVDVFALFVTLTAVGSLSAGAQVPPAGSASRPGEIVEPGQRPSTGPRDAGGGPATGTARLRGLVVAADTGVPLRRAVVRLMSRDVRESRSTMTDARGRFELENLPAGRFTITAAKGGFVPLQFGQRRPFEEGRPVQLRDGEALDDVDFALPRAGVITGRVLDEAGEPVSDVMVQALRYQFIRGRRRLVPAGRFAQSNDIGTYRLHGLSPGDYYVSATVRGPGGFMGDVVEDVSGYAPTYYPGTPSVSEAQRLTVAIGQEVVADFELIPATLSRITGVAVDSAGKPLAGGMVMLAPRPDGLGMMLGGSGGRIGPDGTFTIGGVAPGGYTLIASTRDGFGGDPASRNVEVGSLPITVAGENLSNLVVQTSRGATVRGHIVVEGAPASFGMSTIRVFAEPRDLDGGFGPGGFAQASVAADATFELAGLSGARLVRVMGLPPGWQTKAIFYGTDDISDTGFEARGQPATLRVVVTSQVTELTGSTSGERGEPLKDYVVVAFSEDPAKWEVPSGRYVATARADQDGRYRIEGLPPGRYLAAAVESLEQGSAADPDVLELLRASATEVTLGEGERKGLNLKLAR